jgi:phenylacetic acid degradation operon negative regulatory protein
MTPVKFDDLVRDLTADQTPRVWSLLVSLFGELAQDADAQISGTLLGRLTALMGIRPEAVRVALHRLRKDGWIQSERRGRSSVYALTGWGRAQSAQATPRIYDLHPGPDTAWLVVFDPSQSLPQDAQGVWVSANTLITHAHQDWPTAFCALLHPDASVPDWIADKVCGPQVAQQSREFLHRLQSVQDSLPMTPELDPFEAAALRILIVDGWRRIVLRTPHLPPHVFPPAWAGQDCRRRVSALLSAYPRTPLANLEMGP